MFHRHLARQLLPGLVLPGLIYLAVSGHSSTLVALAAASSVPVLDALLRMARRERPSPFGLVFLAMTGVSIGLAFWLHSPRLILVKGAVVTGAIGLAFGISALVRRPLTRWVAMRLSVPAGEARHRLVERWHHPTAHSVFCTLSAGWGILMLVSAAQQGIMAFTVSPGVVMAVEPGLQFGATALGIVASVMYVKRRQRLTPGLALLPTRVG